MVESSLVPSDDGVTHINVFSKGQTEMGRLLTNFAFTPFKHPTYGHFASMEAFWYWLGTGKTHNQLRRLYGASAKMAGRRLQRVPCESFQEEILQAIQYKIEQTPRILQLFRTTPSLPLAHYYVYPYGTTSAKVVHKPEHSWQLEAMEALWKQYAAG